ncbi:MAG: hypothetical protein II800_02845, partial [Lachnospiraceae bacterium]|nr:hypothetical protein [Lachnospiraceae bacterium]
MRLKTKLIIAAALIVVLPFILILLVLLLFGPSIRIGELAAIAGILMITSLANTFWLSRGMTEPINELNRAMQHIRD